jgi:hypothetical protein
VDQVYPEIAQMLFIDVEVAKAYVEPLGQAKFDKAVGSMVSELLQKTKLHGRICFFILLLISYSHARESLQVLLE